MSLNLGKIISHYNKAKDLLDKLEIKYEENFSKASQLNSETYSDKFKKATISNAEYPEIYKIARDYHDYNLYIPSDGSLFQFSQEQKNGKLEIRYAYLESPFEIKSYEDFLKENDCSFQEVQYEFFEEYEQYVSEANLKKHITNIRYDYSETQYNELCHPTSHIHIGQQNHVRMQLAYTMLPSNFVAFIMRNVYWERWKSFIQDDKNRLFYLENCKIYHQIPKDYLSDLDKKDICIYIK
ncbi:hypothetical protein IGK15_001619 [Enterococcus sp. AZ045]|uniref:DUF2290 domain-containing protein n=1 Tax=Enterococcus sp. AZ045 TaxID=2774807 RepID=UPI003F25D166